MTELVVRGGAVVIPEGVVNVDIAVDGGMITAIAPELPGAATEIDARSLTVLPGVIDIHVHFNEPGRTDWEGAATGSRAFAAGGGTLFFDMPLNSSPCTVSPNDFDAKLAALEQSSITDFAVWGGIVPDNLPHLADLAARGVIGFKAFMADSGLPEFPRCDEPSLFKGMREAARLGLPVAVHAEDNELINAMTAYLVASARTRVKDFLESRPVMAEVKAIQRAALLAEETGAKLHIVHVSSGSGVAAALEARARGVDISIETCPHYLLFTEEDLERIGAAAKCAPPLRNSAEQKSLWEALLRGDINALASDHSPAPPEMKRDDNFFKIWGGVAGVQSTLPALLTTGYHERGLRLTHIANLLAAWPAKRFGLLARGAIAVGNHADFTFVDMNRSHSLRQDDLLQRHKMSPYIGKTFQGDVRRTILRGETIFLDGRITAEGPGKFVRGAAVHQ